MITIEEIYKSYFHDVYLYILGLSESEQIAEEVTAETFFKAMRALPGFRGECEVRVWLCQIAQNGFYTYVRKSKRYVLCDFVEEGSEENRETGRANIVSDNTQMKDIEKQLLDTELAAAIYQKVHELPEPQKEVFHLRVFGELSFEQIGKIFGKKANWACVTYHRAKSRIQREMEEW